ncbi:MAG: alpha/beta hydrolase [Chthonomonadales bacterium]
MKLTRVSIPSQYVNLCGLTYEGDSHNGICAVVSHGFTASKESVDLLAAYLATKGTRCLTFDARGHKLGSTGGVLDSHVSVLVDLQNAVESARNQFETDQVLLIGHSMGGILSMAGALTANAIGVVVIAAGPDPGAGFRQPAGEAMLAMRSDYVEGMEPIVWLRKLGELVPAVDNLQHIPTLFIAARGDVLVKASRLQEMAERAGDRHTFREIDGSHLEAPDKARGVVGSWIQKHFVDSVGE